MSNSPVKRMRVFAIESPSALDMLADRSESQTLQAVCKLLGHNFASTHVRSIAEFKTALNHVTSINVEHFTPHEQKRPLCLHIAAHGNDDGLAFGPDDVTWEELASDLWQFFHKMADYPGPIILVISACGAEKQKITKFFAESVKMQPTLNPAAYVLTTIGNCKGEVYWRDAVVAWSIFYHQIGSAVLHEREDIKRILDKIKLVGAGTLKYFRWDKTEKDYIEFKSKLDEYERPTTDT